MVTVNRGIGRWAVRLVGIVTLILGLLLPGFALARNVTFDAIVAIDPLGGGTQDSLVHGDLDNDGDQDLLVANPDIDRIDWYANDGDGNYGSAILAVNGVDGVNSAAAYDLDNDGDLDVLGRSTSDNRLFWAANNGTGTFAAPTNIAASLADGLVAEAADLDSDGDLDVYAGTDQLVVYENTGGGTFAAGVAAPGTYTSVTVANAGDVDNDGDIDIIVGAAQDDLVVLYKNDGTGSFAAPVTLNSPEFVERVLLADLNRDGDLDLLIATNSAANIDDLRWFPGNGNGTFGTQSNIPTVDNWTLWVNAADVDLDGDLDLVSGGQNSNYLSWHENLDGIGNTWLERTLSTVGVATGNHLSALAYDYDNDGDPDFAGSSGTGNAIYSFENRNVHRTASLAFTPSGIGNGSDGLAVGDINRDGIDDLVIDNAGAAVSYYLGNGNGSFGTSNVIYGEPGTAVAVGHIDTDGQLDVAFAAQGRVWGSFNINGSFTEVDTGTPISTYTALQIADLDHDGDGDIVAISTAGELLAIYNISESFSVEQVATGLTSLNDFDLSDLDDDGDLDIVAAAGDLTDGNPSEVAWYPNAVGSFGAANVISSETRGYRAVRAGDLDSDGDDDLVVAHLNDGARYLSHFLNNGSGSFAPRVGFGSTIDPRTVELVDIDSDGDLDAISQSISGNAIEIEQNNGNATFTELFGLISGSNVIFPVVIPANLNRDGRPDLITLTELDGTDFFISSVINDGGSGSFFSTNTGVSTIGDGEVAAVSRIFMTSYALSSDPTIELAILQARFENGSGGALNATQMDDLFAEVRLYSDDDGTNGFSGGDTLLSTVTNFAVINNGYLPFDLSSFDGDPAVQANGGSFRRFHVVVEMEPDAAAQSPDQFFVIASSEGSSQISSIEDSSNDTPLVVMGTGTGSDAIISVQNPLGTTVNNVGDAPDANSGDGNCETATAGQCTLRAAIEESNAQTGMQTISFNIAGEGPHTITPDSNLPTITEPVIIDGTSEPDYVDAPVVRLDGTVASEGSASGLNVLTDGVTIKGMAIGNFSAAGILINGSGFTVSGNYLGTFDGDGDFGNGSDGIRVDNATSGTIGGAGANDGNLISGNNLTGIGLVSTQNVLVTGNRIGTNAAGTAELPNSSNGINITNGGSSANTIRNNLISGNGSYGVLISEGSNNIIQGNSIGLNGAGTAALPNGAYGVYLAGIAAVTGNIIGGDINDPLSRNIISGNGQAGVVLDTGNTTNNTVLGNYIGTNGVGSAAVPNVQYAVYVVNGANGNTIGGDTEAARNLINGFVLIQSTGSDDNVVAGNYIGTTLDGNAMLGKGGLVSVAFGAQDNIIGGGSTGRRNIIAGTNPPASDAAVQFFGPTTSGNQLLGNYIGIGADGTTILGNDGNYGVVVYGPNNQVGGPAASDGNLIGGNQYGIYLDGTGDGTLIQGNRVRDNIDYGIWVAGIATDLASDVEIRNNIVGNTSGTGVIVTFAENIVIDGNRIGTNAAGTAAVGNLQGLNLGSDIANVDITNNLISGNLNAGLTIVGPNANDVVVQGNRIGTNAAGTGDLGNTDGIWLINADNVVIGGDTPAQRNVISGNDAFGILIQDSSNLNMVQGNYIGTNISGAAALPNTLDGVKIQNAATNLIGGSGAGQGNLISGNSRNGVYLQFAGATGNLVQGNNIGTNAAQNGPLSNAQNGVALDDGAAGNSIGGSAVGDAFGEGNLIVNNGGDGVRLTPSAGTNNSIRGNQIIGSGGLGIDLAIDGVTANDTNDGDAGANGLQNFPVLTPSEDLSGTIVQGTLNSTPGENFTLDFYSSPECDASGNGEGPLYLGSIVDGVDDSGNGSFSFSLPGQFLAGQYIIATATATNGSTSEFSACAPVATNNLWTGAFEFPLNSSPTNGTSTGTVNQLLTDTATARWYKFDVTPGSNVRVEVNAPNGSIVTLHKDVQGTYDDLLLPESEAAAGASSLPGGYLPGGYLPGGYLPGGYLPGGYLPGGYLESGSLPGGYLPGGYLPGGYLPGGYLPGGYLPGGYLPGGYLPGGYLPGGYLPGGYLPGGYLPEVYSGAQYFSLMAVAFDPNATFQTIERNTFSLAGSLYVRVAGPASATPIELKITLNEGICGAIELPSPNLSVIAGDLPGSDDKQTVILWDSLRMRANYPTMNLTTFAAKLQELANQPAVDGVVIDLAAKIGTGANDWKYPRVRFTHGQADRVVGCAEAKSIVAEEITKVVKAYRAANVANDATTLKYVTIVGSDDEIPFQRLPDLAGLASEDGYIPPVGPLSATEASLRTAQIQSQDLYGSRLSIWRGSFDLPIPDLAVGRLVKTPSDITGLIDAFIAANGQVAPRSALITGYDFVADGAELIEQEINKGLSLANCATSPNGCISADRLIQPERTSSSELSAWTGNQLRSKLFSRRNDLIFFTGHFYAGGLVAADNTSGVLASEVLNETGVSFTNSIVFALGCHSGFSLPPSAITSNSPVPDWSEAFARRGATYVAATGYAYGDTELAEYGERLMINLSKALRTGTGPVAVGSALVDAKIAYLAGKPSLSGLDEKTLLQFTVYGLPMMAVDMPGQRIIDAGASVVENVANVPSGPGASFGLGVGEVVGGSQTVSLDSTLTRTDRALTNESGSAVTASYLSGSDGVVALPIEPILPLEIENVSYAGKVLRGTLFMGGTYNDLNSFIPLTSAATTEGSRAHPAFYTDTFYPSQNWGANLYAAIDGGPTFLQGVMGQYRSNDLSSISGKLRAYEQMDFKLFYMADNWADDQENRVAAVAPAPQVLFVESSRNGAGKVEIKVNLLYNTGVGVQQAVVTWTNPNASGLKSWQSFNLIADTDDPTLFSSPAGGVSMPDGAVFMVQAVNGAGLVGVDTNQGQYYPVPPTTPVPPPPPAVATAIEEIALPRVGFFEQTASFSVRLRQVGAASLANQPMSLIVGGLQAVGRTDSSGVANFALPINLAPGSYPGRLVFAGADGLESALFEFSFSVERESTSLDLTPVSSTASVGGPTELLAELTADSGKPVDDRTIIFIGSSQSGSFVQTAKTNFNGQAVLGIVTWPAGTYSVRAYFAGSVPLPGGSVVLSDQFYKPAVDGPVSLTLSSGAAPTITSSAVTAGIINSAYSYDVNATGSPKPYYAFVGMPPAGMTINGETGLINWLPTTAGSYPVTVRAANSVDPDATQSFSIVVANTANPLKISPVLERGGCVVANGNGTFTAYFGYSNPNSFAVTIPVGNDNKFSPNPQGRGQTTTFLPGRQISTFSVVFSGGNLVWTLNGKTSTASSGRVCNQAPVAVNDTATVSYRGTATINVRANDSDSDGNPLTITAAGPATKGTVSINTDGTLRYVHTSSFALGTSATDTFSYTISDGKGGTATASVTVTISRAFACNVLDNFNRTNGSLNSGGKPWNGSEGLSGYGIRSNQAQTFGGGPIYWKGPTYNANQAACIKLTAIPSATDKIGLLLKVQSTPNWREGAIDVNYYPALGIVRVDTLQKNNNGPFDGWRRYAPITASFAPGDIFAAIAWADGKVQIFKNGLLIGTSDTRGNSLTAAGAATFSGNGTYFVDRKGRIGLWHIRATDLKFDDFGGGSVTP